VDQLLRKLWGREALFATRERIQEEKTFLFRGREKGTSSVREGREKDIIAKLAYKSSKCIKRKRRSIPISRKVFGSENSEKSSLALKKRYGETECIDGQEKGDCTLADARLKKETGKDEHSLNPKKKNRHRTI